MSIISSFRSDFSSALFENVKGVWWRYAAIVTVLMIISTIISLLFLGSFMNMEFLQEMMTDPQGFIDEAQTNPQLIESAMYNDGQAPGIGLTILIYTFSLVLSAWMANILLLVNDGNIRNQKQPIGTILSEAGGKMLLYQMGLIILLYIGFLVAMVCAGMMVVAHWILAFLAVIFVFILALRFTNALAAIVHGRMNTIQALSYSWKSITWKRAGLLFLFIIVAYIAMFIVLFLAMAVMGVIGLIPYAGPVIMFVLMLGLYTILSAVMYSGLSGMYFRYSDDENEDEGGFSIEDHLIADE